MSMTDPVADLLTRVRNASSAKHPTVTVPMSLLKLNIVKILKEEGFVRGYRVDGEIPNKKIVIDLAYDRERQGIIRGLRRVSRPGRRVYVGRDRLPRIRNGLGIAIVSTSRGVMSDAQASAAGVGGEFLCEVW